MHFRQINWRTLFLVLGLIAVPVWNLGQFWIASRPFTVLGGRTISSGDGASRILGRSGLNAADMSGTQITDDDLKVLVSHILTLPKFHTLDLSGTQISDEGLKALYQLRHIRCLYLGRTHFSDEAIRELRLSLPETDIINFLIDREKQPAQKTRN
jgi:hypothetical protein